MSGPYGAETETGPLGKNTTDRGTADVYTELLELALDSEEAPRVLLGDTDDEIAGGPGELGPAHACGAGIGPAPSYELAMPARKRLRRDEEARPPLAGQRS